ncbi:response regulator [Bythopirellula polymerisocia]|uniref:Response regulator receiver domain protein n=1 Tax=Bythopirellula polymerisocia TaxID=2528003 RepID=A0A5C6CSU1_9BACT|nr:response regulator [Bythopirellula polymerisocia]TWU27640.1 Response regulator receiver domain protein [Bythopirellula polymerisocia]
MSKHILDVGNCGPDFTSIKRFLTQTFDCTIEQTHGLEDTLAALRGAKFDLVLINRKLDRDYSDGIEILRKIKEDSELKDTPVMLITNFPEHQDAAVELGAERGFGKLELGKPETREKLEPILG